MGAKAASGSGSACMECCVSLCALAATAGDAAPLGAVRSLGAVPSLTCAPVNEGKSSGIQERATIIASTRASLSRRKEPSRQWKTP